MGIPTLISTATPSGAANVTITSGIDSTYDEYMFVMTDIFPATDGSDFQFITSVDGGSNYGVATTTTAFRAIVNEGGASGALSYRTGRDAAQSTSLVHLTMGVGGGADEGAAGIFHLFSPASTTYVKHFYSKVHGYHRSNMSNLAFTAGYINDTTAIDDIQFKMGSGNFDGTIKMWGVK